MEILLKKLFNNYVTVERFDSRRIVHRKDSSKKEIKN